MLLGSCSNGSIPVAPVTLSERTVLPVATGLASPTATLSLPPAVPSVPLTWPTATFNPATLTAAAEKVVSLTAEAYQDATRAALPPGPTHTQLPATATRQATATPAPTEVLSYGIVSACGNSEISQHQHFRISNCWLGLIAGVYGGVFAGVADPEDMAISPTPGGWANGGLYILTHLASQPHYSRFYWTPVPAGGLEISQVQGSRVTLRADNKMTFVFDLSTHYWLDRTGAPMLPPSPSPTVVTVPPCCESLPGCVVTSCAVPGPSDLFTVRYQLDLQNSCPTAVLVTVTSYLQLSADGYIWVNWAQTTPTDVLLAPAPAVNPISDYFTHLEIPARYRFYEIRSVVSQGELCQAFEYYSDAAPFCDRATNQPLGSCVLSTPSPTPTEEP